MNKVDETDTHTHDGNDDDDTCVLQWETWIQNFSQLLDCLNGKFNFQQDLLGWDTSQHAVHFRERRARTERGRFCKMSEERRKKIVFWEIWQKKGAYLCRRKCINWQLEQILFEQNKMPKVSIVTSPKKIVTKLFLRYSNLIDIKCEKFSN